MVKLICANMRKDRNVLTAFLFVLILSSLLLHTGLFVGQYSSIYDEKVKERKEADVLSYIVGSDDDISEALSGIPEIAEFSIQDMVMPGTVKLRIEGEDEEFDLDGSTITRIGEYGAAEEYYFLERNESEEGPKIYFNSYYAKIKGIKIGDEIHKNSTAAGDIDFTVAARYEALIGGQ